MATTSLWRVKGDLGRVIDYAGNELKTSNPDYIKTQDTESESERWLTDVIKYAVQDHKTTCSDENNEVMKKFVSGINCTPDTARAEMMATKRQFTKTGGIIAYHGYLSFAPGEATPEIAHKIGVKLATQLWGSRHEVIVTTHLDKINHLHCHFVINTVSFVDGKKFHRTKKDYYEMQKASDALCREYGLSVIENPKRGKSKHYSEWNAERNGQPTYRSTVKNDIDICIRRSMTERQFFERLQKLGYEIKGGKDISVRAFGRERSVRLQRNFGSDYSIEGIRNRILSQTRPEIPNYLNPQNQYRYKGRFQKPHRNAGLRALYFYYLHRLGHFNNKTREPTAKQIHYAYREDIRYARRISQEIRLLVKHGIDTDVQLDSHKQELQTQLDSLNNQRKLLRNKLRSANTGDEEKQAIKDEISELSKNMSILRRDISMCDEIEVRSKKMENNIKQARNDMKTKGKEVKKYELFRGRR